MLDADVYPLSPLDICHFGDFFRRVRESLGLQPKEVANFLGDSSLSRISRFETRGTKPHNIDEIFDLLRPTNLSGFPVRHVLSDDEVELIQEIYRGYLNTRASEEKLAAVDFGFINRESRSATHDGKPVFPALIERMHTCGYPAFLIDEFWFIHAINGAGLNVFGLDPNAAYMKRWEFWHVLGTKFAQNSPVRDAHMEIERYFRPSVEVFFKSISPFLFTIQVRRLLDALHHLSKSSEYEFSKYWNGATTFSSRYPDDPRRRILRFNDATYTDQPIHVMSEYEMDIVATDNRGHAATFMLGFWHPNEPRSQTQEILQHIWKKPGANEVFFAADYDVKRNFHVNSWPEVQEHLMSGWIARSDKHSSSSFVGSRPIIVS